MLGAAVLGYGAWQAQRRADLWLRVNDHAGRTPQRLWSDVVDARLAIRDAAGHVVAEVQLEPPQGLPRWTGPPGEAVDCQPELARDEWQRCFDAQSRWMARWARAAHDARVTLPSGCVVERSPVVRREYGDWWLWWVPLPHVGGTPISHHTLEWHVDSARCASATAP